MAIFGAGLRGRIYGAGLNPAAAPQLFVPDFEDFFLVHIREPSLQLYIQSPHFRRHVPSPRIAVWIDDEEF